MKEHRRFSEFADAVREHRSIGVCYGPPGVGKTLSARRYAYWDVLEPWLRKHRFGGGDPPAIIEEARSVFYTLTTFVAARQLDGDLYGLCRSLAFAIYDHAHPGTEHSLLHDAPEQAELVIVDEADRLKTATLEQLRDFFDRRHVGLLLIGMPGLEKRLARYPQLYSRIGFAHRISRSASTSCASCSPTTGNDSASSYPPPTSPTQRRSPRSPAPRHRHDLTADT